MLRCFSCTCTSHNCADTACPCSRVTGVSVVSAAYARPNHGVLGKKEYVPELRGTFSAAVADSVRRRKRHAAHPAFAGTAAGTGTAASTAATAGGSLTAIPSTVPLPLTALNSSRLEAAGSSLGPVQLAMVARCDVDEALPVTRWTFQSPEPPAHPQLCMHAWEHTDGAQFCGGLFGHYLMPNGE